MNTRRAVFRADASIRIGTGHVMRCLTLADSLRARGVMSAFICREQPGHLVEVIRSRGYDTYALPTVGDRRTMRPDHWLAHSSWLAVDQETDAAACRPLLERLRPQWLVVDHYALDERWEARVRMLCSQLLAIDDLADRRHRCDVLLDQNLGRTEADYSALTPEGCVRLIGPRFALLREEFAALRAYSISRRRHTSLKSLLITLGGVDAANVTGRILEILAGCALAEGTRITVIMGRTAPHLDAVKEQAAKMTVPTEVFVGVSDMAQHMADADLCVGAAGGTAWERCCLGLPTLLVVLAENQRPGASALAEAGAVELLDADRADLNLPEKFHELRVAAGRLACMSAAGLAITSGSGAAEVAELMVSKGAE